MFSFSKSFKSKFGFISTTSLAVLSALLSSPAVQAMDDPQDEEITLTLRPRALDPDKNPADQGDVDAQNRLGVKLLNKGDYEGAMHYFTSALKQGSADAQFNLGIVYEKGQGVPKNPAKAAEYYKLAAEQGHAKAQNNIGFTYFRGDGVGQDYTRGLKYLMLAAEQKHTEALCSLGTFHFLGEGVPQDKEKAFEYYRLAAVYGSTKGRQALVGFSNEGDAYAQHEVASLLFTGKVFERDQKKAFQLYTVAAKKGNANSQFALASLLEGGVTEREVIGHGCSNITTIVPKDESQAFEYYNLAAIQGHADALYHLGCIYSDGLFKITQGRCDCGGWNSCYSSHPDVYTVICAKNPDQSRKYFELAAERGHEGAQKKLQQYFPGG